MGKRIIPMSVPERSWFGPLGPAVLLLAVLVLLIRPFGNFPLNDDWQYAHVARQFAETGRFQVDVQVAPTLFVQSALGATVSKWLGFSHTSLRLLTLGAAVLLLAVLNGLLKMGGAGRRARTLALLLLVSNPIFLNLSLSFMTEIYGALIGFFGVWLWFRGRKAELEGRMKMAGAARWAASAMMGMSFWVRQFAVLVFPAILIAHLIRDSREKGWARATLGLRRYWKEALLFVLPIALYFPWARATGNLNTAFSTPLLKLLLRPAWGFFITQGPIFIFYVTAFFLPFLILVRDEPGRQRPRWILMAALAAAAVLAYFSGDAIPRPLGTLHRFFPFLGNIWTPYGVGVVTLSDVLRGLHDRLPSFAAWPWLLFEASLIVVAGGWIALWRRFRGRGAEADPQSIDTEIVAFGVVFSLLTFATAVQAYLFQVFERYYFGALLGLTLALPSLLNGTLERLSSRSRQALLMALPVLALGAFSLLGTHDYFRWNEVRWQLLRDAQQKGISAREIDGGYELNGWLGFEDGAPNRADPGCSYAQLWACTGRRYQIAIQPVGQSEVILRRPVRSWLRNFPDLLLVRSN
jgi:hypothetical protein